MKLQNGLFDEHLKRLEKTMKKEPYWKTAFLGTVFLEEQWMVYQKLAIGRDWNAVSSLQKVMKRFWQALPTGYRMDDKYLVIAEENPVTPVTEQYDPLAGKVVANMIKLIYDFSKKDQKAVSLFAERNFEFLSLYCEITNEHFSLKHPLAEKELAFQTEWMEKVLPVTTAQKKEFITEMQKTEKESILRDYWFSDYRKYPPKRVKAKPLPPFRRVPMKYEALKEQAAAQYPHRLKELSAYEDWLIHPDSYLGLKELCGEKPQGIPTYIWTRRKAPPDYVEFYACMITSYYNLAQLYYQATEDTEGCRGYLHMAACSHKMVFDLIDAGFYCNDFAKHVISQRSVFYTAQMAVAANDCALALALLSHSNKEECKILSELLQGHDEEALNLLKASNSTCSWKEYFQLILNRDKKGLYQYIKKDIISMRRGYEQIAITLFEDIIVYLKLAKQRGIALEINAYEIPEGMLEDTKADQQKYKIVAENFMKELLKNPPPNTVS